MKIGILTITPNVGFGGIMQAFALQNVLQSIANCEVEVIQYRPKYSISYRLIYLIKGLVNKFIKRRFSVLSPESELSYRSQNVSSFHQKYLHLGKKVSPGKDTANYINQNFDIVFVGSDQVWRPIYVLDIYDYFFKGVKNQIKKFSYAASLGVDYWEFTKEQTEACSNLLHSFHYVSVRENSAVSLIKENMHYQNTVHWDLDPTLLLRSKDYLPLFSKRSVRQNYVFTYVLDNNADKQSLVDIVAKQLDRQVCAFSTNGENYSLPLQDRVAPPVEDWLSGIFYSDYVVTDSFHGCVFAINFNKPFIVYVNKERGADRFQSILTLLGLEDRMVFSPKEYDKELLLKSIDWNSINHKLANHTADIKNRLKNLIEK